MSTLGTQSDRMGGFYVANGPETPYELRKDAIRLLERFGTAAAPALEQMTAALKDFGKSAIKPIER